MYISLYIPTMWLNYVPEIKSVLNDSFQVNEHQVFGSRKLAKKIDTFKVNNNFVHILFLFVFFFFFITFE